MRFLLSLSVFFMLVLQPAHAVDRGDFGAFQRSLNTKKHGYKFIKDPTGAAPVRKVERFEVRPGDCARTSGWDDCAKDRERSELSEKRKSTRAGEELWYGWHIYLPADWKNVWPTKVALGQFHQKGSHPVWMFQNDKGGLLLDQQTTGRTVKTYRLLSAADMKGRWNRIEVHAKWSKGRDGVFNVYVNGAQKVAYRGPTMSATHVYFKYGVYRSYMSRYKNAKGVDQVPGQTAYFANVRRAKSRSGL